MAITNAQQFKQLVNPPMKGKKRPGYRGDAAAKSTDAGRSGRADPGSRGDPGEGPASRDFQPGGPARERYMGDKGIGSGKNPMAQFSPEAQKIAREMLGAKMGAGDRFVPNFFPITKALANRFQVSKPTPFDLQRRGFIQALSPQITNTTGGEGQQLPTWAQLGFSSEAEYLAALARGRAPSITEEEEEETFIPNFRTMAEGGRAGLAEGGMPYEGGIMDLESARQMYGLGKLVKKVTRTVKKIAKSPLGKAAILGAGTYFGLGQFGATKNLGKLAKLGIAGAVAGLPLLTQQEEEEEPLYAGADIADPRFIMANPQRFQNIRLMAEGGSTEKEPVAKKTMPLLDMGGQEMDLRAEGGFVPIGRMEKADDVPARLSKNEFVFTADAVRNAGDGDVDKGAEVMYNMMKNLEAGGDVSEESQGLEGARKMFQTSQRLEEVL
jgi:hypothetical protein